METLNMLNSNDFTDRSNKPTIGHFSDVLVSENNFQTLLFKYNKMVNAYNQLAIKVFDIEQALKGE